MISSRQTTITLMHKGAYVIIQSPYAQNRPKA
jgi:hypothetical protein